MENGDSKILNLVLILSVVLLCSVSAARAKLTSVEGSLLSFYIDKKDHSKSELRHYLRTKEGKAYKLHFKTAPKHPEDIKAIKLKGLINDRDIEVESFEEMEDSRKFRLEGGTQAQARGNQRTLVVPLKNFSTNTGFLYSSSQLNDLYFSSSTVSINSYFSEVSDSAISFTGNVASTINVSGISDQYTRGLCVPGENLFDGYAWLYALDAVYQQHNLKSYDRVSIVVPNDSLCLGANTLGIGTLGKAEFEDGTGAKFSFSFNFVRAYTEPVSNDNTFVSVAAHEMGHNLGLKHDNGNSCGKTLFKSSCRSVEYGGAHSIMGFATNLAHVNAIHQEDLGWFISEIVNVSGTAVDQTITISPMASDSTLPKAIKIARGDGSYYMVEYRKPVNMAAYKAFNAATDYSGFLVYLNNDRASNDSILFASDFGSSTSPQSFSTRASFTTSFIDDVNKIQVIPMNLGTDSATLRVVIGGVAVDGGDGDTTDVEVPEENNNTEESYGWNLISKDEIIYAQTQSNFGFDMSSQDREQLADLINYIEWDYDSDGRRDVTSYSQYATGDYKYRKAGIYTITARVKFKNGKTQEFILENINVVDYIHDDVRMKSKKGASTTSEAGLNRLKQTRIIYEADFDSSQYDGYQTKLIFPGAYKKYFKTSKKYKKQIDGKYKFKLVAKPEKKLINSLRSVIDDDGYYEVPVDLEVNTGTGYFTLKTILKLKSSY